MQATSDGYWCADECRICCRESDCRWTGSAFGKIECQHNANFEKDMTLWKQSTTIEFKDGQSSITETVRAPKGVNPPLASEEIF